MTEITLAGRQPIFDRRFRIVGYELLYRGDRTVCDPSTDGDRATAHVLTSVLLDAGNEVFSAKQPAFINFTRNLLMQTPPLPPELCILELVESVLPDPEVLARVEQLRQQGYRFALDDFEYRDFMLPLVKLATIVKLDVLTYNEAGLRDCVRKLRRWKVQLLAEKVETVEQLRLCHDLGCDLFQGYLLKKPETLCRRKMPRNKLALVAAIAAATDQDASIDRLAGVVGGDPSLAFLVLRIANSPLFPQYTRVSQLKAAILRVGVQRVLSLAVLAVLSGADDAAPALVQLSLERAFMCSALAESAPEQGYLVGLLSVLDVAAEEGSASFALSDELRAALTDREGHLGHALQIVLWYEAEDWERLEASGADVGRLGEVFWTASGHARQMMEQIGRNSTTG